MTTLINKILAIFQLKLVSTKPVNMVEETVKFLNTIPKGTLDNTDWFSTYVGDVVFVKDKITGKSYFRHQVLGKEEKYYDYDGDTYTPQELQDILK